MDAEARSRPVLHGVVLRALHPLLAMAVWLIEAAAVAAARWGYAWDRSRGRSQIAEDAAKRFTWEAWRRLEAKDWRGARYFAKVAIAADLRHADGYRMLAVAHDSAGQPATAREVCQRGLRVAPDNALLWSELGRIEARGQRLAAAEAHLRKALELQPDHPRTMRMLAAVLEDQRRWREALPLLQRVRGLEPTDNRFLVRLARVLANTGAFEVAETVLKAVIEAEPSSADAHYWLAISMAGTARWDQAIQEAGLAVRLAPDDEHYRKIYDLFRETGGKGLVLRLDDRSASESQDG